MSTEAVLEVTVRCDHGSDADGSTHRPCEATTTVRWTLHGEAYWEGVDVDPHKALNVELKARGFEDVETHEECPPIIACATHRNCGVFALVDEDDEWLSAFLGGDVPWRCGCPRDPELNAPGQEELPLEVARG